MSANLLNATVAPIFVGPGNSLDVTGQAWRFWRDNAPRLHLRILRVGSKPMIEASALLEAVRREQHVEPSAPMSEADELDAARKALAAELAR